MAASVTLQCPECEANVPVELKSIVEDGYLIVTPDLADVWAHAWTHKDAV